MSKVGSQNVRVAVVGARPAGIGAALGLARRGIGPVLLLERWDEPGGVPAKYRSGPAALATYIDYLRARVLVGQRFAQGLLERLARTEVQLRLESNVVGLDVARRQLTVVSPQQGKQTVQADAIVLAVGAREENLTERGWIAGTRGGQVFFTMQLLELLARQRSLGWHETAVVGSDTIAYLAAAELHAAGARRVQLFDAANKPATSWPQRCYFRRWGRSEWQSARSLTLSTGPNGQQGVELADGRHTRVDALLVSGRLVPNAELLLEAGLEVQTSTGVPRVDRGGRLSAPGWFAAGNVSGGFHGGQWAYFHGQRAARSVAQYLRGGTSGDDSL